MGNFSISGVFTAAPDPDVRWHMPKDGTDGRFSDGKPIRQKHVSATLTFPPLTSAEYNELYTRWTAHMSAQTSGALPKLSAYGWRPVSAWWDEPVPTGWDGGEVHGVTMLAFKVIQY